MSQQQLEKVEAQVTTQYDADFFRWTQDTAELIRQARLDELDLEHVAEEIQDMGNRDKREVYSRLKVLLMHLLKWEFQPALRSRSWEHAIREQRSQLKLVLKDSPSLVRFATSKFKAAYSEAVEDAVFETGLPVDRFSRSCPYATDEILTKDFLPGSSPAPRG
jgi:Domain of unknown function DUF29